MKPESPRPFPDDDRTVAESKVRRNRETDEEDTIALGWYVQAIARRWQMVVAGAIVCGAVAFWASGLQPLRYEAITSLLVVPPPPPSGVQINPATFRAVVENGTLAAEVISELKLDADPDPLTPQRFLDKALRVEEIRGTNVVRVKVTLADPAQAAEASRRLALKAIALTQHVNQQDGASIQSQLKKHLQDAQERMEIAERNLLSYKQAAQLELMSEDTKAQLKERGDLLRLMVDIESERARLDAAEAELKRQPAVLSVPRRPEAEQALRQVPTDTPKPVTDPQEKLAPRSAVAQGEVNPLHLDLTNPFVNPVHQTLEFQVATTRTRLAALTKQRDELVNVKGLGGKSLSELSELYRRQIEQARLEAALELSTKVYSDLAVRYEESRTQPLGNTAQLQVIDLALPPDQPVSRERLWFARWGLAVGLVVMTLLSFGLERRRRP